MGSCEKGRFDALDAQHPRALKLQGKAAATIDSYARAVRRVSAYFDRCPDRLKTEDFNAYFAWLIDARSRSLVKIERCGMQFFYEQGWASRGGDGSRQHPKSLLPGGRRLRNSRTRLIFSPAISAKNRSAGVAIEGMMGVSKSQHTRSMNTALREGLTQFHRH
ncbi:phage integrase N-terminal SAM-like domain-containing protein [Algiphilus sp. W345]|uniref:Phage integrase N-terminal SAM-like domain-containing protein n=1 Tax=Banduia mediterranea TaxID=3075609 RepID=A0ABU2WLG6_9GAMM|nr:phage integrase N-terminal SAM-like domain-containing protein [Algiphilus sp. W345]MDT0498724.1 phage integrase N-terminal SAM-like domain-containing protein [Algiphilus sp. W345]